MSSEVAAFEAEVKEYKLQLETVQSGLQADPDNAELLNLQTELEEVISLTETAIAELKPAPAAPKKASPPPREKWSKENHPAYQAGYRKPEAEEPEAAALAVNDAVMAKWKSGDRAFYPAKITAITGSKTKPLYMVTFRIDGSTDTLMAHDLRPMSHETKKRKADAGLVSAPSAGPVTGPVISAAADINPALASQAKEESTVDGQSRPAKAPRKVKANKELEAGKNKWKEFSMKGKTGKGKKDSMFRTGEGVNARVGFTGSGQEMRKDPTRMRHKYSRDADEDY